MKKINIPHWIAAAALAVACLIVGASVTSTNEARAEVSGTPERPSFQTGGQLSVPVLREIAATLRQIDARLARLETAAQKIQAPATATAAVKD